MASPSIESQIAVKQDPSAETRSAAFCVTPCRSPAARGSHDTTERKERACPTHRSRARLATCPSRRVRVCARDRQLTLRHNVMRLTCATRESRYDPGSVPSRMIRRMTSRCHEQPYQRLPLTCSCRSHTSRTSWITRPPELHSQSWKHRQCCLCPGISRFEDKGTGAASARLRHRAGG